jgi:histidine triad (HIT) family protein
MTCLFCRIAAGEIPAHRIAEDDLTLAFLDLHPIRPGHALVIPKAHHVWFEDLPDEAARGHGGPSASPGR